MQVHVPLSTWMWIQWPKKPSAQQHQKTSSLLGRTHTSLSASKAENSLFSRIIMSFFTAAIWDITRCSIISCQTSSEEPLSTAKQSIHLPLSHWAQNRKQNVISLLTYIAHSYSTILPKIRATFWLHNSYFISIQWQWNSHISDLYESRVTAFEWGRKTKMYNIQTCCVLVTMSL